MSHPKSPSTSKPQTSTKPKATLPTSVKVLRGAKAAAAQQLLSGADITTNGATHTTHRR